MGKVPGTLSSRSLIPIETPTRPHPSHYHARTNICHHPRSGGVALRAFLFDPSHFLLDLVCMLKSFFFLGTWKLSRIYESRHLGYQIYLVFKVKRVNGKKFKKPKIETNTQDKPNKSMKTQDLEHMNDGIPATSTFSSITSSKVLEVSTCLLHTVPQHSLGTKTLVLLVSEFCSILLQAPSWFRSNLRMTLTCTKMYQISTGRNLAMTWFPVGDWYNMRPLPP